MEVRDVLNATPDEPTPFYTWSSYVNPDFAHEDDPGTTVVSLMGVQVGNMVISMVNGTMCVNPIDEPPISMNFDQYMDDLLIQVGPLLDQPPVAVTFDPQTCRYSQHTEPPPQIHYTRIDPAE